MEERIRQIGVCCKSHLLDQAAKVMPGQNIINIHKNIKFLVNFIVHGQKTFRYKLLFRQCVEQGVQKSRRIRQIGEE